MCESKLTAREAALCRRGYDEALVLGLSRVSPDYTRRTAERIVGEFPAGGSGSRSPRCVFLGGQAGSGKSTYSRRLSAGGVWAEIGLDCYRTYHPAYRRLEEEIRGHWARRVQTPDDSPGNDMADFTHRFAGEVADMVIPLAAERRLDMLLEWGLRTPEEPLAMMEALSGMGYEVSVCFLATDAETSFAACGLRSDVMEGFGHIMRRVSREFHDLSVATLPQSCGKIYEQAVLHHHWCGDFRIIRRSGDVLWQQGDPGDPCSIYGKYLHAVPETIINDPAEARKSAVTELRGLALNCEVQA